MVLPHLETGGAEKQTIAIAKGLAEKGLNTAIFVFTKREHLMKDIPAEVKVIFSNIHPKPPFKTVLKTFSLIKTLREFNPPPNLIYTRLEHAPVAIAGKIAGIPTVTAHVNIQKKPNSLTFKQKKDNFIARVWVKLISKLDLPSRTVANSEGLAVYQQKYLKLKSKPMVIYNGADLELIEKRAKEPISHRWIGGDTPLCVSVARLAKQKGFENLIDAFAILNKRIKVRLLIVGEGVMRNTLTKKIEQLELSSCVELTGIKTNPYPFMTAADLYVQPSVHEGFSNTLLEAVTLGKPIVSTDFPYGANEIIEDGKSGILVPVGDTNAMADAIERVLKNTELRESLSHNAKERSRNFTMEKMISEYEKLFRQVSKI